MQFIINIFIIHYYNIMIFMIKKKKITEKYNFHPFELSVAYEVIE